MKKLLFVFIAFAIYNIANAQVISTVAGNGLSGFNGDGNAATNAELNHSVGIALDHAGNLYIADWDNHVVRKVDAATGIITTIAGNTVAGFSGDGGLAVSAQLNRPSGLAVDSQNNIYIADENNNRIRKINAAGFISTVVGTGVAGFSGNGNLATSAQINAPTRVFLDSAGALYISDNSNHMIRKVNTSGFISTVAGIGTGGFSGDGGQATNAALNQPSGLVLDAVGNIYIVDEYNHRIRKVNTSGTITTIAGNGGIGYTGDGGSATAATLNYPQGLIIDNASNLYVVDSWNNVIRKISASTGIISTFVGTGTAGFGGDGGSPSSALLNGCVEIRIDQLGDFYISDWGNSRIRKVTFPKCGECSGIEELSTKNKISIYPNPSNGVVKIAINKANLTETSFTIINHLGQVVRTGNVTQLETILDLSDLSNGVYFVNLLQNNQNINKKIIIQK